MPGTVNPSETSIEFPGADLESGSIYVSPAAAVGSTVKLSGSRIHTLAGLTLSEFQLLSYPQVLGGVLAQISECIQTWPHDSCR